MNVSLTPELETFIENKVKSGRYNTASEVVREGLRLLEREDKLFEMKRDELRREVKKGIEQIRSGEYIEISSEDLPEYAKEIGRRGRERKAAQAAKRK
ncbi:MAG: type II toxin-antitoxin system ParD family antitoxin [Chloracidobacterium sp.]|nr:type II toxin-antitoxin system ParD family antitoxin [Chloracidobacterium sp.]